MNQSSRSSHQLGAPQIVKMDDAAQVAAGVDDGKRRDLLLFHNSESGGGELVGRNDFGIARHTLASVEVERFLAALFEQAAQIAVADDAQQALAVHHGGDAKLLA